MISPDLNSRIEAAARAFIPRAFEHDDDVALVVQAGARLDAERVIRAAFRELFTDPPSAWLAPWEVSESMANEMECQFSTEAQWEAARDAHLNLPPKDEEQDG